MGLSTKQVSVDQDLDWSQSVLQSEFPKPAPARRLQNNPMQSEPLKCPRCDSINTKFCYYNNYNKSQPRHFCKACKRHWTKGGTLRNVPVGGGRKNKRSKRSKSISRPKSQVQLGIQIHPQSQNQVPENDTINSFTAKILGNNGSFLGLNLPVPQNEGLQFPFSNLSNFATNPCFQSSIDYKYESKLKAIEDPAGMGSSINVDGNQTWDQVPSTSTSVMELQPNYWNWNDMVSADLNIPWDDDENYITERVDVPP
ncbi:hypothetical protein LguiA_025232 [Lonicera macranthoides]